MEEELINISKISDSSVRDLTKVFNAFKEAGYSESDCLKFTNSAAYSTSVYGVQITTVAGIMLNAVDVANSIGQNKLKLN